MQVIERSCGRAYLPCPDCGVEIRHVTPGVGLLACVKCHWRGEYADTMSVLTPERVTCRLDFSLATLEQELRGVLGQAWTDFLTPCYWHFNLRDMERVLAMMDSHQSLAATHKDMARNVALMRLFGYPVDLTSGPSYLACENKDRLPSCVHYDLFHKDH